MPAADFGHAGDRSDVIRANRREETEVEGLRRRLERERKARRQAERIAEQSTRELYDRQAELILLEQVAVAANQAQTLEEAVQVAIDGVCAHTGWPLGHCQRRTGSPPMLVSTSVWHVADPARFESFQRATEEMRFPTGVGLPGRVLASGEPAWITDVSNDPNFPRAEMAAEAGLKAAFAFPVLAGPDVVATLEFFATEALEPDRGLLGRMAYIGTQIGRVIERASSREDRERLRRRFEVLLNSAGEGIYGVDADGDTTFVNPAAARMLGVPVEKLIGRSMHEVVHGPAPGEGGHPPEECPFNASRAEGAGPEEGTDLFWRSDLTSFPVDYIITPLHGRGEVSGSVVTFKDVTERRRFESQLQYLADHDALTGLLNRRCFEKELEGMVAYARRYGPGGAALVLDLDNFKSVNDALGHHAGDELIRAIGGCLRNELRETDVLARLGGDEFAVLLPGVGEDHARTVARKLVEAVRGYPVAIGERSIAVTASIGVTLLTETGITGEELLMNADLAMYAAKESGRDGFAVYGPEQPSLRNRGVGSWTERIRRALAEDSFLLYFQPIYDIARESISQFEILLRMQGDDGEVIPPGAFLPAAERFGLAREIDHWVIRAAVRLLAEHTELPADSEVVVEVNLSGKSIGDGELPRLVAHELATTSVNPRRLVFELTETAAIGNMNEARALASRLTQLGCRFALDDFGAGFASFYYLKYLPLSYLKIDGEFIKNLPHSPVDQRIVRAMVEIARGLGLKTIAEFVGDKETLRLLHEYGVDFAQGYYIGKPRPVTELPGRPAGTDSDQRAAAARARG